MAILRSIGMAGSSFKPRLNRFIAFDENTGILESEAGVSFAEIIEVFLPRGWFLPTTPGTKFVTVGGAIAADIHGKNHHRDGSFGRFVVELRLMLADGSEVVCSPNTRPELFWATVGGMGLTGCILSAKFLLKRVPTAYVAVTYRRTHNLDETLEVFSSEDQKYQYSVAWIDCLAHGEALGRSVVMLADDATVQQLPSGLNRDPLQLPRRLPLTVPFNFPPNCGSAMEHCAFSTGCITTRTRTKSKRSITIHFFIRWIESRNGIGYMAAVASCSTKRGFPRETSRPRFN